MEDELAMLLDVSNCHLTAQQRRVMDSLCEGKSNKAIARDLGIMEGTVKVHVNSAYKALGVNNRVEAANAMRALSGSSSLIVEPHLPLLMQ